MADTATAQATAAAPPADAPDNGAPAIPDDYIPKATATAEANRAAAAARASAADKLLDDPDFIRRVAAKYEFVPKQGAQGEPSPEDKPEVDLEAHKRTWTEQVLTPKVQALTEQITGLQARLLDGAVLRATTGPDGIAVRDEFLRRPKPGQPSYLESVIAERLEFDDEFGFVALDEQGNRIPSAEPGRPYAGPRDLLAQMKGTDEFKFLFREPEAQRGSGYQGANGTPAPKGTRRSQMSHEQKAAYIDQHGQDAYFRLPQ